MTAESDALKRIAAALGTSRWHPFKRRAWTRLMATGSVGAHWTDYAEAERVWFAENVLPLADVFEAELSEELPDGYSVAFDVRPLGMVES